jgi:hypothetical protein
MSQKIYVVMNNFENIKNSEKNSLKYLIKQVQGGQPGVSPDTITVGGEDSIVTYRTTNYPDFSDEQALSLVNLGQPKWLLH